MNIVDKIYNLILEDGSAETFNKNPELFQEFYYHHMSIQYNGEKVISIYKYLLSLNIDEEHETMPFINSKIFEDFNRYEKTVTQSVYLKDTKIDDDYVDKLFHLLSTYLEFEKYKDQASLDKLIDYNRFERDCTGSMIVMLNSSFFDLSDGHIKAMSRIIKRNHYLSSMLEEGKINNHLLDKDYLFQYVSRYLFNVEFLCDGDLSEDTLVKGIINGKIKDKNTLLKIFKYANSNHIVDIFDGNMSLFTDVLEKSLEEDFDRKEVFEFVSSKLLDKNKHRMLFDYILSDERNEEYISSENKERIINGFINDYPEDITDKEVDYLLEHEISPMILLNLKESLKKNDWDQETKNKVTSLTNDIEVYDYDFETSISVFEKLFYESEEVNEYMVIGALKGIVKQYLGVDDINFFFFQDDNVLGCTGGDDNTISLNYNNLIKLVEAKEHDMNPDVLGIIQTVFHEARHIQQFSSGKDHLDDSLFLFYEEDVLRQIVSNYYDKNYIGISFERDARIVGAETTVAFLRKYFPNMNNSIDFYEQIATKEKNSIIEEGMDQERKSIFELSKNHTVDEMISKFISLNPFIAEDYPLLVDGKSNKESEITEMLKNDDYVEVKDNNKTI